MALYSQVPTISMNTGDQEPVLYTCLTCQIAFYSAGEQRDHYRTDWHRYNLKRKVAGLGPVSAASFSDRAVAQKVKEEEDISKKQSNNTCDACQKSFGSENAFNNHLKSRKHKELEKKLVTRMQEEANRQAAEEEDEDQTPEVVEVRLSDEEDNNTDEQKEQEAKSTQGSMDVDGDETSEKQEEPSLLIKRTKIEREINNKLNQAQNEQQVMELIEEKRKRIPRLELEECLFCSHVAKDLDDNIQHMFKSHSFFIPDLEFLVDLEGLICYLGDKLRVANVCLYCNGRGRGLQSLEAVRTHMIDKGHCKLAYETEIDIMELSDFYDFSASYADAHEHDPDEDIDMEGTGSGGGIQLAEDGTELVLPSGSRIGHRSLRHYYRQYLRPVNEKESVTIHRLLTDYAANEDVTTQALMARRNRATILAQPKGRQVWKDMAEFKETRHRQQFDARMGVRSNNLQRHFRADNPI
ncbi:pre-60S factor rei1 [Mycoemilia scoparia]|uniref:Pre-60S factor rei1 n=1 Tax=Mycoemilia scoparia TaxID=417184 RepID=A0A9W8A1V4_9FUNG|nr:pre-60S factor rei1 [Mycoemilia scoparia]